MPAWKMEPVVYSVPMTAAFCVACDERVQLPSEAIAPRPTPIVIESATFVDASLKLLTVTEAGDKWSGKFTMKLCDFVPPRAREPSNTSEVCVAIGSVVDVVCFVTETPPPSATEQLNAA